MAQQPETSNSPNLVPFNSDEVPSTQVYMSPSIIQEYEVLFGTDSVRRRLFHQQHTPQQSVNVIPNEENTSEDYDDRIEIETCSTVTEREESVCRNLSTDFNEAEFPDSSYLTPPRHNS